MNCERCGGLLYSEVMYDQTVPAVPITIWACINCGNRVDRIIQRNRVSPMEVPTCNPRPPGTPSRTQN
jgi:hypothetical protein